MMHLDKKRIDLRIERTLCGHKAKCTSVAFNPLPSTNSKKNPSEIQLISASLDHTLTLWSYLPRENNRYRTSNSDVRAYRFIGHTAPVNHVCYSPSGQLVASCSSDKTVRLWVPNARGESVVLNGHNASVRCVDFSHSYSSSNTIDSVKESAAIAEALLLTCSDDKTVKVWNLPHKSFRCSLLGHTNWVRACKFSPDTSCICASGGDDGTVRLWDVERNANIVTLDFTRRCSSESIRKDNMPKSVRHLVFHPSATSLTASTTDGMIELYDLRCDKIIQHYDIFKGQDGTGNYPKFAPPVSFHPNGNYMLCGGGENILDIWDVRMGRLLSEIKMNGSAEKSKMIKNKNPSCISSVSFSADGTHFACTGSEKEVLVWNSDFSENESISIKSRSKTQHSSRRSKPQKHESTGVTRRESEDRIQSIVPELEFIAEDVLYDVENENIENIFLKTNKLSPENDGLEHWPIKNHNSIIRPTTNRIGNQTSYDVRFPSLLEGTLEQIVGQLTIITRTLELLDKRLSTQEDTMKALTKEWADRKLESHESE